MQRRIALVYGTKTQLKEKMPAEELFSESGLFRNIREYIEASRYDVWFILTPYYGLVHPTEVIKPHDLKLSAKQRASWATKIALQLKEITEQKGWSPNQLHFDLFTGAKTARALIGALRETFGESPTIDRPLGVPSFIFHNPQLIHNHL